MVPQRPTGLPLIILAKFLPPKPRIKSPSSSGTILTERIINNYQLYRNREKVSHVHFYGAGCGVDSPARRIEKVFKEIFTRSKFSILEDTYAAVYASTEPNIPDIVCIIGTGSNCTYFDGRDIEQRITSLGYVDNG